ncbi:MAG: alpha/beta hydrolase [Gammaproteobacteria bacterium]|nr:alpha/beta hydrolase [Gammaproteobacteria bacterium]MDH4311327.1 alpha/beta hydrolase [Gammaproteobacteria bacterium]MDH5272882.1 alpha/beta hydrolase [Gammaproteobacteria bacterium]
MTQAIPGENRLERLVAAVLRTVLRATLLPTFRAGRPIPEQRRRLALVTRLTLPARGVDFTAATRGGVSGEFAQARGLATTRGTVLYLHGGAYCVGSPATHRAITSHLARRTAARVFVADYRLAPEHPFPAAVDDAVAAYRALLRDGCSTGHSAIIGDSAGGGLALATALRLRDLGEPLPAALVLFSPWVDLGTPDRGVEPAGEAMLSRAWTAECARLYLGGRDSSDPLASPINGELRGLPPTLVQVGQDELLLPDARRLHSALAAAEVPVELQEYPRRWHVFQVNAGVLADADRALAAVARFLGEHGLN